MIIAADFERVYEIRPVFCAEDSNIHRHLTKFIGLDLEETIKEHYHEVKELLDGMFKSIFKGKWARKIFGQPCTGSQGSYISSATKNIEEICTHIFESGKLQSQEDLRVGLVAFRNHPPQDHTYVVKNFGFSSDISKVHRDLAGLYASGGGDGQKAVTAALAEALHMDWREHASKMVVLIADAPPQLHRCVRRNRS
ncbi:hypothetical protein EV702DRAFT_721199 [Suillus placidus]|uniref:Aminoacyl-tRNA synthetase class II (D/K/N) domain-containing protein n=1 Tax=Suillus placidus TaxID=48579 RepID=A0A9P7A160_9AGAM|nr:hypothetical protein EV702DRAFT_721199 [Suillus placidus]